MIAKPSSSAHTIQTYEGGDGGRASLRLRARTPSPAPGMDPRGETGLKQLPLRLLLLAVLIVGSGAAMAFTLPGISTPAPLNGRVLLVSRGSIISSVTPSGQATDVTAY